MLLLLVTGTCLFDSSYGPSQPASGNLSSQDDWLQGASRGDTQTGTRIAEMATDQSGARVFGKRPEEPLSRMVVLLGGQMELAVGGQLVGT